tara:strand:+ start:15801 stop:16658 length:858 start_codon:yes stop_codon:yes gene_type:complete
MTQPYYRDYPLADGVISARVWARPGAPVLVFAHANGFCASAYIQMLEPLADQFEIIAPDLRGHGRTRLPADPDSHRDWTVYGRDLAALYAQLPVAPSVLAGHSMGAVCSLLAAASLPIQPRLALIEPVILPLPLALLARWPGRNLMRGRIPLAGQARRRANGWPDREAALERYSRHKAFARWAPGVLEDWLADGLIESAGQVRLACDPAWEAANYEAQGHDVLSAARQVGHRTRILRAEHGSTVVSTSGLVRRGCQVEKLSGVGHLAPMEAPGRVSEWLSQAALA